MLRVGRNWIGVSVALAALCLGGCGAGVRYGVMDLHLKPDEGSLCPSCASSDRVDATFQYVEFRIVDWTGMMMSMITTAGTQAVERERAMDRARARGAEAGEEIEYAYRVTPIQPGLRTELNLRLSVQDVPYRFVGEIPEGVGFERRNYLAFDLRGEWAPRSIFFEELTLQAMATARLANIGSDATGRNSTGYDLGEFHGDVYLGALLGYQFAPQWQARLDVEAGIVTPFLVLLGVTDALSVTSGAEVSWMPLGWLSLDANARIAHQAFGERGARTFWAGLGATLYTP